MTTDTELPYHDYRGTRLPRPDKVFSGLDGQVHGWVGRYRRRSSLYRQLRRDADAIVAAATALSELDDVSLKQRLEGHRQQFRLQRESEQDRRDALAAVCAAADRSLGLRPYAVQVTGTLAMHLGFLIEMATGEGKSLTAALAATLAGWSGHPCHLLTVNDYLAGRDAELFAPLYQFCGVTVAAVSDDQEDPERSQNYRCDLVYTTAKQLLADFLRDRLKLGANADPGRRLLQRAAGLDVPQELVLRGLDTVIVDEADSVLIDEAVSPMIISRQQDNPGLRVAVEIASRVAERFRHGEHYRAEPRYRSIRLTSVGEQLLASIGPDDVAAAAVDSDADSPLACVLWRGLWSGRDRRRELLLQALTAREFYRPGQHFVIDDGKVVIVDEFTGRLAPQRSWSQGLHQAIEAGQGVELSDPNETLMRLSFQRFFRLFRRRSGMSGTVAEGAEELWRIYRLSVFPIPEHRPCKRELWPPRMYADAGEKWQAIVAEVASVSGHGEQQARPDRQGRPVLIGTRNVAESERLAGLLDRAGIPYQLLNAQNPEAEADIIAAAGESGRITIATNMAGRGTDIALAQSASEQGGLHVIVSEWQESGRIDRQLIGRGARQGDPGSARIYASAEDELLQRFAGRAVVVLKPALQQRLPGARTLLLHSLRRAQRRAQAQAFRQRRSVLDYDTWLEESLTFSDPDTTAGL